MTRYKLNLIPSTDTVKTASLTNSLYMANTTTPATVDLRRQAPPVYDQGQLGSCTAFSIGKGLREMLDIIAKIPHTEFSARYLYYFERCAEHDIPDDNGANLVDGLWTLVDRGICPEAACPYDIERFTERPDTAADVSALMHKVKSTHHLPDLAALKANLAAGYPAAFGMQCYSTLQNNKAATTGYVDMPPAGEAPEGGHAVCAVGYDDVRQVVIVRNSWSATWGDKGYFYLPYAYFLDGHCFDIWTAR